MEKKYIYGTLGVFSVLTLIGFLIYPPVGIGILALGILTLACQIDELIDDKRGIQAHEFVHKQEFEYTK